MDRLRRKVVKGWTYWQNEQTHRQTYTTGMLTGFKNGVLEPEREETMIR